MLENTYMLREFFADQGKNEWRLPNISWNKKTGFKMLHNLEYLGLNKNLMLKDDWFILRVNGDNFITNRLQEAIFSLPSSSYKSIEEKMS